MKKIKDLVLRLQVKSYGKAKFIGLFIAALIFTITYNLQSTASLAQQPSLLTFTPSIADLKVNEEKIISLKLNSSAKISGLDLKFNTSGPLTITDFSNKLFISDTFNPFDIKQVNETILGSNGRAAYILTTEANKLPETVEMYIKIKGTGNGQGKISLDYNNSQILDGNGKSIQVTPVSATYNLNQNQSSAGFIEAAAVPKQVYSDSTALINLRIRLFGTEKGVTQNIKASAVAVGRIGEGKYETQPQNFILKPNPDGTFSGSIAFPNFKDGTKFSLMLKADKYLLRRICNPDAGETKMAGYICTDPNITIRSGETLNLDLSKIWLIPGDLGASDVLLNGYDLSIVRNNLGKNTVEAVGLADLNYDGTVDKKDLEIIHYSAANTLRKGDQ